MVRRRNARIPELPVWILSTIDFSAPPRYASQGALPLGGCPGWRE
jgi:hypothetical protein